MKPSRLALQLAVLLAAPLAAPVFAADVAAPATPTQVQAPAAGAYLGVLLGPVPDALRAQLGAVLPSGQGVLVRDVMDGSPAAQAGLKAYDILIGYDDQKLFSADQLTRLVRADSPDQKITLRVVRGGAMEDTAVTLGQAPTAAESAPPRKASRPAQGRQLRSYAPPAAADNWESFDSISLNKRPDGSFKAEIRYLDQDGKLVTRDFSGSRDAIRQQIAEQADLPAAERQQLLDTLSARDVFLFPPPQWFVPGFYLPRGFNW